MPLTADVTTRLKISQTNALDLVTGEYPLAKVVTLSYANGTSAGQADVLFHDTRTVNASSNDDLDLAGVLVGAFGNVLTFARLKAIYIAAASGNTNNVVVGGGTNPFLSAFGAATDKVVIRPGGLLLLGATDATSYVVTAATGDILRVANSGAGTSVTYDVVLIGASA